LLLSGLACIPQLPALVLVRLLGAPPTPTPTGAPTQRMHLLLGAPTQRVERTFCAEATAQGQLPSLSMSRAASEKSFFYFGSTHAFYIHLHVHLRLVSMVV
jgi:hypothetical protein